VRSRKRRRLPVLPGRLPRQAERQSLQDVLLRRRRRSRFGELLRFPLHHNGLEDSCGCAIDCGAPADSETACADGFDDDCDGYTDCVDFDCDDDTACAPPPCDNDGVCDPGEDCHTCSGDCASLLTGKPAKRYCCGDGVPQQKEGDGTVCDGNF
jgi:hypothetical protein